MKREFHIQVLMWINMNHHGLLGSPFASVLAGLPSAPLMSGQAPNSPSHTANPDGSENKTVFRAQKKQSPVT